MKSSKAEGNGLIVDVRVTCTCEGVPYIPAPFERGFTALIDKDPTEINWQFSNEIAQVKLKILYPDREKNRRERERRQREEMDARLP